MRYPIIIILLFVSAVSFAQIKKVSGTYNGLMNGVTVTFNDDSTFEYFTNGEHPAFNRWESFAEKGKWSVSGDTVILNPQLGKKVFVESEFKEEENKDATDLQLTFNHIKRYIDANGNIVKTDTVQIQGLDYSFNELKKKKLTRVTPHRTVRCSFAGYIPKEIITTSRTISINKPSESINSIFVVCTEAQGVKEFGIKNPTSNRLTFNVYSNYYLDGQIRQVKILVKNEKVLYTKQKANGQFEKDNIWTGNYAKLVKQKTGS